MIQILIEHKRWLRSDGKDGKQANLENADLSGTKLYKAELKMARLRGAILEHAELEEANLDAADLRGANLTEARLESAFLKSANLQSAILEGANLEGVSLFEANLKNATLKMANLEDACMIDANLENANFEGASLLFAEIDGANLKNTNFKNALLNGASLEGVYIDGTNLTGADLSDAIFNGNSLEDTINDEKDLEVTIQKIKEISLEKFTEETADGVMSSTSENTERREMGAMRKINIDPGIIENAKREFIEKLKSAVNIDHLKTIVTEASGIKSVANLEIKSGEIVSHNNQISYRLDVEMTSLLSLIIDSEGNVLAKS